MKSKLPINNSFFVRKKKKKKKEKIRCRIDAAPALEGDNKDKIKNNKKQKKKKVTHTGEKTFLVEHNRIHIVAKHIKCKYALQL